MNAWKTKLDDKYDVLVEYGEDSYHGFLVVKDGEKELLREATSISYGARFGADMDDVARWQTRACEVVDALPKP
jgi:hypothetical protein